MPRKRAAFTLWPDHDEDAALANLRRHLALLESALPGERADVWIRKDRTSVQWIGNERCFVDAARFEVLSAAPDGYADAVALYRGEFLESVADDEWIEAHRERLRDRQLSMLSSLAKTRRAENDLAGALDFALHAFRLDPWREDVLREIMLLRSQLGDVAGALSEFQKFGERLKVELGVEPMPETRTAAQEIAAGVHESHRPAAPLEVAGQDPTSNNLPRETSELVGRSELLVELSTALQTAPLVTLTGTGGVGKTRLALRVAADSLVDFPDGAWFVDLAVLSDGNLVGNAVASALGLTETPGVPIISTIVEHLKHRRALLVLDNCEHVLGDAASVGSALLRECSAVRVLATSREELNVSGESVVLVPPLLPPEAVLLFVERAHAADARFRLSADNADIVAEICWELDHIPLAIELAAVRVKALGTRGILEGLAQRFRLLTGGRRELLPRQQTLQAVFDWGHALLSERERMLFRRLGIFVGGWSLAAAAEVCADERLGATDIADVLAALVGKSLVATDESPGVQRFRFLESTRQYALARLEESGEAADIARLHLEYFIDLGQRFEASWATHTDAHCFALAENDLDNIRTALNWSIALGNDALSGAVLVVSCERLWTSRLRSEGRRWIGACQTALEGSEHPRLLAQVLATQFAVMPDGSERVRAGERAIAELRAAGDEIALARALLSYGHLIGQMDRVEEGGQALKEALALSRAHAEARTSANCASLLAMHELQLGNLGEARSLVAEAFELCGVTGSPSGQAYALYILAEIEFGQSDPARALVEAQRAQDLLRPLAHGARLAGMNCCNMAAYAIASNHLGDAFRHANEALDLLREMEDVVVWAVEHVAVIAGLGGDLERAVCLLGFTEAYVQRLGLQRGSTEQVGFRRLQLLVAERMSSESRTRRTASGAAMTVDQAIAMADGIVDAGAGRNGAFDHATTP